MNEIEAISKIKREKLDERNYFKTLIEVAYKEKMITEDDIANLQMQMLQLLDEIVYKYNGLDKAFQDVEQYLGKCKFSNCTHTNEPGCKILEAIANGELYQDRFDYYIKLQNEAKYNNDSESYLNEKREKFKKISKINKSNKKDRYIK